MSRGLGDKEVLEYLRQISEDESGGDEDDVQLSDDDEFIPEVESGSSDSEESVAVSNIQDHESGSDSGLAAGDFSQPSTSNRGRSSRGQTQGRGRGRGRGARSVHQIATRLTFGHQECGSDGTVWTVIGSATNSVGRRSQQNIFRDTKGPTLFARKNITEDSVVSAWRLMINDTMLRHIKSCTEAEARNVLKTEEWSISLQELEAFIAVLYARGIYEAKGLPVLSLWSETWGPPFFTRTMARNRFLQVMRFIRFDTKSNRSERLKTDKFAHASFIWNTFIENCLLCYKPGENVTADEQLFPTKARCPFTQYMPNKPDKFGIKFWLLVDVESKYLLNGFPYTGRDENRSLDSTLGEDVVMRLMNPYLNTGRNITTNNYFTSLKLAGKLKSKATSLVGTLKRAKKEVPAKVKDMREPLYSTTVLKTNGDTTMTVYQGKVKKNVLLLSTLHPTVDIADNEKKTPETVSFYNSTKYGVDILDQMARKYSVKSSSRRWPVHVFFNILDLAAINAWIIYKEVTGKKITRRQFVMDLCNDLSAEYVQGRKRTLEEVSPQANEDPEEGTSSKKRRKCNGGKCKGNKTVDICTKCRKPVCGTCQWRKEVTCSKCSLA